MTPPLVPSPAPATVLEALQGRFDLLCPWERDDPDVLLAGRAAEIEPVADPGEGVVGAELMDRLPNPGLIAHFGVGYDTVDEQALIAALSDGTIAAAGLDVYENEPDVPSELLGLPNAVLLPHVGSASLPTRRQMAELGAANLESWFADRTVRTPVPEARDVVAPQRRGPAAP